MSKSYTLADGSTVTVTATENGVPFNEGMQALTKAIKARVAVRDGSGSGGASGFPGTGEAIGLTYSYDSNSETLTYTVNRLDYLVVVNFYDDDDAGEYYAYAKVLHGGNNAPNGTYTLFDDGKAGTIGEYFYLLCFSLDAYELVDIVSVRRY